LSELIKWYAELRQIYRFFKAAQGHLENTLGVSVCKQCGKCCHTNVLVREIEALLLVSETPPADLLKIGSICEGWLTQDNAKFTLYEGIPIAKAIDGKLREEWSSIIFDSHCPFHKEDNTCMVHDSRPLVCRAYGVTNTANNCTRPPGNGETSTQKACLGGKPAELLKNICDDFFKRLHDTGRGWTKSAFLPTLVYRHINPTDFYNLVDSGKIPSAKLVGSDTPLQIIWENQAIADRLGIPVEFVDEKMLRKAPAFSQVNLFHPPQIINAQHP